MQTTLHYEVQRLSYMQNSGPNKRCSLWIIRKEQQKLHKILQLYVQNWRNVFFWSKLEGRNILWNWNPISGTNENYLSDSSSWFSFPSWKYRRIYWPFLRYIIMKQNIQSWSNSTFKLEFIIIIYQQYHRIWYGLFHIFIYF